MRTKYIFISGGVISGLGKGITTASLALLLKSRGFRVAPIKADPYLNVDAGTMNPLIHGETFVTEDGLETDQDLGHYERFINENLNRLNYMTLGQVCLTVIQRERNLEYGGICVEPAIHIPEEINNRLKKLAKSSRADFVLCEIGGTAGEYQNALFLEASRQLRLKLPGDVLNVHVGYLPMPSALGELKSKPMQTSVHLLNEAGVQPDIIIGRASRPLDKERKEKISIFCNVAVDDVFSNPDTDSVYHIPEILSSQGICERIFKKLNIKPRSADLNEWRRFTRKIKPLKKRVEIAIVGKYFRSGDFSLEDSYVCVIEAVKHATWHQGVQAAITWIDSLDIEKKGAALLKKYDGIIVPQGWGSRGIEGKIMTAQYARENNVPFLGLCFGMQLAAVEFARNVCGLKDANTQEADPKAKEAIIHIMPEQAKYLQKHQYGGTMRLGAWPCKVKPKTLLAEIYGKNLSNGVASERHRHRFEFNNAYRTVFEKHGLVFSGVTPDNKLVEALELPQHRFFLGTQFHPEFKSRPLTPHPIFLRFISACLQN